MKRLLRECGDQVDFINCDNSCNKTVLERCVECEAHRQCFNKLLKYEKLEHSSLMIKDITSLIEKMFELAVPVQDREFEDVVITLDKVVETIKKYAGSEN